MQGLTLWFTGLPGAGKTTLACSVADELKAKGVAKLEILDGDIVRTNLSRDLGFSREDRETNLRRIAFVCQLLTRNDVVVIAAAVSPYRETRDHARQVIGRFVEIFVECPLEVVIRRDPKGLYRKALAGEIMNFTGVSDPYEKPLNPDIIVHTDRQTVEESTKQIMTGLENFGYLQVPCLGEERSSGVPRG